MVRKRSSRKTRKTLGVAMVGHAFMGRAHGNAFRQVSRFFDLPVDVALRVVVGRDRSRATAAADDLGFEAGSADLDEVLARPDIDLVDVATPNDSHAEIALAALRAGKDVLCEKPLALDLGQARQMVREAERQGARVGVWHNYRRCPATALAHRIIARGEIGPVRQVRAVYLQDWLASASAPASWRTDRSRCGSGAHGDLNAHLIDLTRYLTGLEFESVVGTQQTFTTRRPGGPGGRRKVVDVDDCFAFLARLSNGATATFEASRVAAGRKNHNRVEISGRDGSLVWDLERMNELQLFRYDDPDDLRGFRRVICMDEKHPYAASWWPDGHSLGYEHTFTNTLADFLGSYRGRRRFAPDFGDGLRVQAVLHAAQRSAETGRWTKVPH